MVESRISTGFPFGFLIATSVPGETPALEAKLTIPPRDRIKKRWSHFIQKVYETDPLICNTWDIFFVSILMGAFFLTPLGVAGSCQDLLSGCKGCPNGLCENSSGKAAGKETRSRA